MADVAQFPVAGAGRRRNGERLGIARRFAAPPRNSGTTPTGTGKGKRMAGSWLRGAAHGCAIAGLLLACADAGAASWTIDVGGAQTVYTQATLDIAAGDTVTFVNRGGFHNVVADDASFRCAQGCDGAGGSGDPSDAAWSATVTLATPGTVGYHCEVHGAVGNGMFGTITVLAPPPPPPPAGVDTVPNNGRIALLVLAAVLLGAALFRRRTR